MFQRLEERFVAIARRRSLAALLVGLAPVAMRAVLLPWFPIPNPRVQDEFSHLLVADTFAHGRLVNPVHPLWAHFESMHILVRPVYASAYPVAQGAIMAVGQVLTGSPWIGVLVSMGLACGAVCWMLQGWMPATWALVGGALAAFRYGVFSYWMNSYYGGAMAAMGGALVLGAFPRLLRVGAAPRLERRNALLMGIGLVLLANSRPYEGLVLALPLMAVLFWRRGIRSRSPHIWISLLLILVPAAAAMGYYFARVTGSPFRLPYSLYRQSVAIAPHFIWQPTRPEPVYDHRVLRDFYAGWELACYQDARANRAPHRILDKGLSYWRFYIGPLLAIPLLMALWLWKRPRTRLLLLLSLVLSAALALEVWHAPHYAAPATGLAMLLIVEGLRHLRQCAGRWPVRAIVLGCVLTPVVGGNWRADGSARANIVKQLEATGTRHVVIVRYSPGHDPGDEWVYNAADIDTARIVWAREMDPASNRRLVEYFRARRAWLVEPDVRTIRMVPYDPTAPSPPFPFVQLGTDAVEALRSPEHVRNNVLAAARQSSDLSHFSCDQWGYFFTQVTGVAPPESSRGCFRSGDRDRPISFDDWFAWVLKQK